MGILIIIITYAGSESLRASFKFGARIPSSCSERKDDSSYRFQIRVTVAPATSMDANYDHTAQLKFLPHIPNWPNLKVVLVYVCIMIHSSS
jgi:hypothetical protein